MSVHHVLLSGGPVSPTFGGGDLGFVRGNAHEDRGGLRWFPVEDNKVEGGETEGQDMVKGDSRDGTREGINSAPRKLY